QIQNTMKLYVGNLSFETTENDLQDLFEQHGQVNEVRLMTDRMTGKSRGFAFVTMNDNTQASAAMSGLNGHELNGRPLTVNEARPREERPRTHGGKRTLSGRAWEKTKQKTKTHTTAAINAPPQSQPSNTRK